MTSTDVSDSQLVSIEVIKQYVHANIPIVPLFTNGNPNTNTIFTKEELETLPLHLPEELKKTVYEPGTDQIKPLKLLAAQPLPIKEFWTEHRIKSQTWEGIACQTGFVAAPSAIVAAVDADDPKTGTILEKRIEEFGLLTKTIVQDTPHRGKHVIFKIPIELNKNLDEQVEFWGKRSLRPGMCKDDCVMEIKMRTMQITLDPTRHREQRNLTYTRTSDVIALAELPMLYDLLIRDLKNYDCLEYTPDEYNAKRENDAQTDFIKSFDLNAERYNLAEPEILAGIDIILGRDDENMKQNSPFKSIYVLHHRHDTVIPLGGYLFWNYIRLESAKLFIEKLGRAANDSSEDTRKSVKKVEDTYRRGFTGQPVIGKRGLIDAFTKFHKDKNKTLGEQRLSKLTEVLKLRRNKPKIRSGSSGGSGIGRINEADVLVNIAEKEIPFFFVNHLNQPCAVVKVRNHYEIMEMNDDSTFLGLLRQMWRDTNIANNKTLKITISEDMLKRARAALVGAANQLERPRIKTHLRVAWKEKNKVLRYDLTNQFWQQVEISATGVRVIDSRTVLDEIKEYQNSDFSKHKVPIFFQRYSNTQEQVLPTESFRPNILDYYFQDLTNVTDKRATTFAKRYTDHWQTEGSIDNRSKILVAKVLLISKFIADIPHFLVNVIGSPGAMKTHYLKFDKRLIDPGSTEVHSPPITTKDIHQKFAHNYYIILDNIGFIEKWLSDLICSVITGSGFECRALWTNQGIVNMILKSCVAVGSVNRVFTAPDALTRLVVQEFLEVDSKIDDETNKSNYLPEDVIEGKFEEIRAELLSCIFGVLSKAIEVKQKITGKYALGRMADVLEWGEAISQAMGYEEREFQRAYESLTLIQQKHAAKSDPLIVIYLKLYYNIFEDPDAGPSYFKEREDGYKLFDYGRLQEKLDNLAESEGYKITSKENKLWPRDSQQLAERSREVSSRLRRTSNVSLEIRKGRDRSNAFILGTTQGVENYINTCEDEERKVERCRNMVVDECVLVLKEGYDSDGIESEELLRIASERNLEVSEYLDGKFRLQDSTKVRSIINELGRHPKVIRVGDRPLKFKLLRANGNKAGDIHPPKSCNSEYGLSVGSVGSVVKYTHPTFDFGTNQKSLEQPQKKIVPNHKGQCGQNTTYTTETTDSNKRSLTDATNILLKNHIKPSVMAAITIPILRQPVVVSEQSSVANVDTLQPPFQIQEQPLRIEPVPESLVTLVPGLKRFATFDTEWHIKSESGHEKDEIYCCCLIDANTNTSTLHINQFNGDRLAFLSEILDVMEKYDVLSGYNILQEKNERYKNDIDSDWVHLHENCRNVGLLDRFESLRCKPLDLYRIFHNRAIESALKSSGVKYRDHSLNTVALAYVGLEKSEGVAGGNVEYLLEPEKQLEYCLRDSMLCMKIISKNKYELLEILQNLSMEIGSGFLNTANAHGPLFWWKDKLNLIEYEKTNSPWVKQCKENKVSYGGGHVFKTQPGRYLDASTFDVNSMYPSVIDIYNLSSETINCDCCKNDPAAYVSNEVMDLVKEKLPIPERPWDRYWICKKRTGKLSLIMHDLMEKKGLYKAQGSTLKEKAIKLLMNSGYGVFGSRSFYYYDIRLVELVTAFSRYTLLGLERLLKENGNGIIYGDTDSLFFTGDAGEISKMAMKFHVKFELDVEWKILFLTSLKKQYLGLTKNGERENTTLYGLKSNLPSFFNEVTLSIIDEKYLESFIIEPESTLEQIIDSVRNAYVQLTKVGFDRLAFSQKADKNLVDYENSNILKQLYFEILEDNNDNAEVTRSRTIKGNVFKFWKTQDGKRKHTVHPDRYPLNFDQYRNELWTCVKPVLEVYGLSADGLNALERELVKNQKTLLRRPKHSP
ncbi:MAG: hypothetical protein M3044_04050 [Thermoproteota archaeon]|nr:hypothetical protein [Thermoproteota archaeon]